MADTVRVGLDRFVLDALGSEALEQRVEPSDSEGDPPRARPHGVRLDEQPSALIDLPENLFPDATVWGSPEEPRLPIDAGVEIGYRNSGEEMGDSRSSQDVVYRLAALQPLERDGAARDGVDRRVGRPDGPCADQRLDPLQARISLTHGPMTIAPRETHRSTSAGDAALPLPCH